MIWTRLNKVGIELEGGWSTVPRTVAQHHADGSVRVPRPEGVSPWHTGEYVSAPLASWAEVEEWVVGTYPQAHNTTCGMHVHISLKDPTDYARLMSPAFWTLFSERMETWGRTARLPANHPFHGRLQGLNMYCQKFFRPEVQAKERSKNYSTRVRYTQLNFTWLVHGTLECRLFPVFKSPRIALSAIRAFLTCVEDFLAESGTGPVEHNFRAILS